MRRLLIGEGPSAESLRQLLTEAGARVTLSAPGHELLGSECTNIIVDELHREVEAALLGEASVDRLPVGLVSSLMSLDLKPVRELVAWTSPTIQRNARPYLKRKKGRSDSRGGRRNTTLLNGIAKRQDRA